MLRWCGGRDAAEGAGGAEGELGRDGNASRFTLHTSRRTFHADTAASASHLHSLCLPTCRTHALQVRRAIEEKERIYQRMRASCMKDLAEEGAGVRRF